MRFYTKKSPRNSWSPHFMITLRNQKSVSVRIVQGIPTFRDFTIRDPRYFVITLRNVGTSCITLILHNNISKVFQDRFVKLYNKATTLCALDLHGFLISNFKFSFTSKRLKIWNDLIMIYVGKWNTCRNETYLSSQSYCKSGFSGNISISWNTRHRFLSISVWLLHFSCKWRFANLAPIFINLARLNNAESSWVVTIALDSWVVRWITWLKYT